MIVMINLHSTTHGFHSKNLSVEIIIVFIVTPTTHDDNITVQMITFVFRVPTHEHTHKIKHALTHIGVTLFSLLHAHHMCV